MYLFLLAIALLLGFRGLRGAGLSFVSALGAGLMTAIVAASLGIALIGTVANAASGLPAPTLVVVCLGVLSAAALGYWLGRSGFPGNKPPAAGSA